MLKRIELWAKNPQAVRWCHGSAFLFCPDDPYLNNIVERDHERLKRRISA